MKCHYIALIVVFVVAGFESPHLVESTDALYVSEYDIGGEDFFYDFMKKKRFLLVRNVSHTWPIYALLNDVSDLSLELKSISIKSRHRESKEAKTETLGSFYSKSESARFKYDIRMGDTVLKRSVTIPASLMSCLSLFERFKEGGQVFLEGLRGDQSEERTISSDQHSLIAMIQGEVSMTPSSDATLRAKAGDLVYIPTDSDASVKFDSPALYVNFSWPQNVENYDVINCGRPSMHTMTRDIDDACPICRNRHLPNLPLASGFEIPPIGLGTARLFEKTYEVVKLALRLGYTLIDTANAYSGEESLEGFSVSSEQEIGRALKDSGIERNKVFILTKVHPDFMSYEGTIAKIEQSLSDLGTDYLDAVLVHDFDTSNSCGPDNEHCKASPWIAWRGLEEMQTRGFVRSIGVSNIGMEDLSHLINKFAKSKVDLVQNWFDPFHQDRKVRKICEKNKIQFMGYSTLGKIWTDDLEYEVNPVLAHYDIITAATGDSIPVTSFVLRWAMQRNVIMIPCSRNLIHVEQNLVTRTLGINEQMMEVIDNLDERYGNPDLPGWIKKDFPPGEVRRVNKEVYTDEARLNKDEL